MERSPTAEKRCNYLCALAPQDRHETIIADFVAPLAAEIREHEALDSLFFVRMDDPTWQVRFRVVGDAEWIDGPYRALAEERLRPHLDSGLVDGYEMTHYQREVERYGGEEGMALAEQIYLHDSLACFDFMALERRGKLARQRRELALLVGELFADLLGLGGPFRLQFYEFGYSWTREMGTWEDEDFARVAGHYQKLRPQLEELLDGETSKNRTLQWGGAEAADVADRLRSQVEPLLAEVYEGHRTGRIRQDLAYLAWSYTHLFCNRLGIYPTPEAILRRLMYHYWEDRSPQAATTHAAQSAPEPASA